MKKSKEIREQNRLIRKQNKQLAFQLAEIEHNAAKKTDDSQKPKGWFKKLTTLERIFLFLFAFMGAIVCGYFFYDRYSKSDYEKFEQDNTIQGDVKSPTISGSATSDTAHTPEFSNKRFTQQLDFDTSSYFFPIIRGCVTNEKS